MKLNGKNGKLLGVCAGLADRTGINALVIRIALVALILTGFAPLIIIYGISAFFVEPRPKFFQEGRFGTPLAVLGALLATSLFIFVNQARLLGFECYYIGDLSLSTFCIKSTYYRLAWVIAVSMVGMGLWVRHKSPS